MAATMMPATELDLALLLLARWPAAIADARRLVEEAEKRSKQVANAEGGERQAQMNNWLADMGVARGYLYALRALHPDPALDELWYRLNYQCPMIMMGQPVTNQINLLQGDSDARA
jgi:hypothetical protein